mmetsp:Transcript_83179/g.97194  ORF Transcript_83179/g.97194 Transcript_83179/m.97194 type:complete len:1020 (+) Transcript_83179:33-3092(+)|eukprot:CAMPEP_0176441372 /NCGR_PEP_ID=MMETSP0127-20121128/21155_1 /TAXON_ID=938130 /ORGANISM="Platyophrya macrostoma, Strain WH" /LENGTH=1019 /DNA_ID=CAMNT_0017826131 /DNA_START=27 /DNA_END=3086 /DNA_ORIENTATION=+
MQLSYKITLALLGVAVCLLVARQVLQPHTKPIDPQPEHHKIKDQGPLISAVYYNQSFNISLKDKFKMPAPTFELNTTELVLDDNLHIGTKFQFPPEFKNKSMISLSVFSRRTGSTPHPTIFIGLEEKLLEYRCNFFSEELDFIQCPDPMVHDLANVLEVDYDVERNLIFVTQNQTNSGILQVKMYAGEDILAKPLDVISTKESCNKFFFAPEYSQLLCVRSSGVSLDAYFYSNKTKTFKYENFTAQSLGIESLDDFVFDSLQHYVNSGIIRVQGDLLFVRNEVKRRLPDPFGNLTEDYRIYAVFPKLLLISKTSNRIIQFDYSGIENIKKDGEYDLGGCELSCQSKIHVSHDVDMFYLTCKREGQSFLYSFNPSTMNLRSIVPLESMERSHFRYSLLNNDGFSNFDIVFMLQDGVFNAQKMFVNPVLSGCSQGLTPKAGSTSHIISYKVTANSELPGYEPETLEGSVTIIFPERPITPRAEGELTLNASLVGNNTYTVYFDNHVLFKGSVHNLTFEPIYSSNQSTPNWTFTPITDFTNSILIPNISQEETIYDYHYIPVKSGEKINNDGVFVILSTNEAEKKGYISTYKVSREENSSNFKQVTRVNKFLLDMPFCTVMTIANIGDFELENLFGFIQCQMGRLALYGYALANGTQVLNETIICSEAWINFAVDDVNGHVVVFHNSIDGIAEYAEFFKFYPVGEKHSNPVKSILYSQLNLEESDIFEPAGYDLIVNPVSQTYELYAIALDGTLMYCSTPFAVNPTTGQEFCIKKKLSEMVFSRTSVKTPAWNGLQIIKNYHYSSAKYEITEPYSNKLRFVLNSETTAAYLFEIAQPNNTMGHDLVQKTEFMVLRGFADYYPDYKKLMFFTVDDKYVIFMGHTFAHNDEFTFIVFDHNLGENDSNHYHFYNGTFTSYPILEAIGGKRYRSNDIGLSPTRVFTEYPSASSRRVITFGNDNELLQYYINSHHQLTVQGNCEDIKFRVYARNDRFDNQTTVKLNCSNTAVSNMELPESNIKQITY